MSLLEREATGTEPPDLASIGPTDESWREYIIDLTDLVRRVGDAGALRGLAMLGIETSRDAQNFVAGFGAQALAPLSEAWTRKPNARSSVVTVWSLLAQSADAATKATALNNLLAPDDTFPLALADAAVTGNLVALVPLLDSLAASPNLLPIVQRAMSEAANQLRPQFVAQTPAQLLVQSGSLFGAICASPGGSLNGYCHFGQNDLDNATKHFANGQAKRAKDEIQKLIDRTTSAASSGRLGPLSSVALIGQLSRTLAAIGS